MQKEKRARVGPQDRIQESAGLNKNIKKLGPLRIGDRGLKTSPNSRPYFSFIVLLIIRDTPLYLKLS